MSRLLRKSGVFAGFAFAGLAWAVAFAHVRASSPPPPAPAISAEKSASAAEISSRATTRQTPPPQVPGASMVGEAKCLECHDQQKTGYVDSPHHRLSDPRTPGAQQGCETCHGAGSKHVDDPVANKVLSFKTMSPDQVNATCATCHNRGEHALWDGSQHESRGLTCITCHSVHSPKSELHQLKEKTQFAVCATCHKDKVAKLDRSGHMPLREGKMECTTCHNTHGSSNVKMLRRGETPAETCTSCHADKRGPFLWDHMPSRDGCTTCHDPHGSSNERMLVAKPPILCQRCHVGTRHPSTIYDQSLVGAGSTPTIRVFARSCVTCHAAIHGSNHPSGKFFIR